MGRIFHSGDSARLIGDDVLEHIADFAGVCKVILPLHLSADDACPDLFLRVLLHNVVILLAVEVEDRLQFIDGVIREFKVLVEAGLETGIAVDELLHRLGVSRDDHDQIVSVVLHSLEDGIDRFLAERVVLLGERICFVDEENAAHGLLDLLLRLEGGLSHISRDQAGSVYFHELALGEHSDLLVEPSDDPGDRRLTGTGIARKHKVQGDRHRFEARVFAELLYFDKSHQLLDVFLDRRKANQALQLLHGVLLGLLGLFGFRGRRGTACRCLHRHSTVPVGLLRCLRSSVRRHFAGSAQILHQLVRFLFVGIHHALGKFLGAGHKILRFFERLLCIGQGILVLFVGLVEKVRGSRLRSLPADRLSAAGTGGGSTEHIAVQAFQQIPLRIGQIFQPLKVFLRSLIHICSPPGIYRLSGQPRIRPISSVSAANRNFSLLSRSRNPSCTILSSMARRGS